MSNLQKHVFLVLYEWWTASYQDAHLSLAAVLDILTPCGNVEVVLKQLEQPDESWAILLRHLQLKRWPTGDIVEPLVFEDSKTSEWRYQESLRWLFSCEFLNDQIYDPVNEEQYEIGERRDSRHQGLRWAYCQMMGWRVYNAHQDSNCSDPPDNSKIQKAGCTSLFTNLMARLSSDPFDSFLSSGPVLNPCPWLGTTARSGVDNLPYFLFDTHNRCTVETSGIESYPDYTVISHTWGRWVKDSPVDVAGIPWKVPQNTRFDVHELPHMLAEVPSTTRYIWFDLFCIPQDGSIIGTREIARQAIVFQNAKNAVAWLNDVESFDGLQGIIQWQLLHLILHSLGETATCRDAIARVWDRLAWKQTGLLQPRQGKLELNNSYPNAWFTSLWTLQEVALRPDIWLCARDWSYATCDGITPLPLIGLITIYETFWSTHEIARDLTLDPDISGQSHVALFELGTWRFRSGLAKLLDLDQVSLLTMGDRRECRERRAEAIMSALGITEWFTEPLRTIDPEQGSTFRSSLEQDLVLGKYPLRFVQELCRKIPGDFFGAFLKRDIDTAAQSVSHGSLLPFDSRQTFYLDHYRVFRHQSTGIAPETHRSVRGWNILPTGQVHMPNAYILSSTALATSLSTSQVLPARFTGLEHQGTSRLAASFTSQFSKSRPYYNSPSWCSLHSWVASRRNETFAIVVQYLHNKNKGKILLTRLSGLIIERLPSGSLVKLTNFFAEDNFQSLNLSQDQPVGWVVN